MKPKSIYLSNLTPLRGIAALLVAIFHFEEIGGIFINPSTTMLIGKSYLMVDLFFIMSGFVMLHVYGDSFMKRLEWKVFFQFMKARFARLYPLHLFTLLLVIAVFYGFHNPSNPVNNPAAIPTHLLLLQSFGIHPIFTWNVPSWSISAEWWAYMVFPLLVLLLGKNKQVAIALMALLFTMLYLAIEYFLPRVNPFVPSLPVPHNLDVTYDYGFLRGIAGFMAGMVTYTFYQLKKLTIFFSKDILGIGCILLVLVAMHVGINDIFYIPLFMLLVLGVAANQQVIHKICLARPLQYLGDISYSVYLMHGSLVFFVAIPIITKLGFVSKGPHSLELPFFTGFCICIFYLLAVIAASSATYYLIEKPCRNWINKKYHKASTNLVAGVIPMIQSS
ncbi:MAG: acyltransferase [Ferruginibacter sp.]|nr:acyltransferase [Ferruginibacter sp.]